MNATDYQKEASRTLISGPDDPLSDDQVMILWVTLGLAGEVGEIVEHVKKGVLHQHGLNADHIEEELGDVMWYLAGLATELGLNLTEIMERNIEKLYNRYPDGFSYARSRGRKEVTDGLS